MHCIDVTSEGGVRNAGLPINVLQDYLKLFEQGDSSLQERKEILIK